MTNRELAEQLGISPAAFSLIINHKPGISEQTRQRVLAALDEMGLSHLVKDKKTAADDDSSSAAASQVSSSFPSYRGNLCFTIFKHNGVVMGHHPFFLLLMESIENRAREYGYNVMLRTLDSSADILEQILQLNHSGVEGVLIMATEMAEEELTYFKDLKIPHVFLDNDFTFDRVNSVSINNQMGTFQAIKHLSEMGHKQIGYIKSSNRISSWEERSIGFRNAAELLGVTLPSEYIFQVRYDEEGSYQDMLEILQKQPPLPSAFVFEDDVVAAGVCRALKEFGYRVPEDISLIGFNNRPICELTQPRLTSVDVPKNSFGVSGIDVLIRLISDLAEGSNRTVKHRISTNLIKRESVYRIET